MYYLIFVFLRMQTTRSTTSMKSSKSVRGPTKPLEGHYIITEVDPNTDELLQPKNNAKKFVNHYGVLVRDRVPISVHELKQKKDDPLISFVSKRETDLLWDPVTAHFNLPVGEDLRKLVKNWALKKMATQFQTQKKKLYNEFVKKNLTPNFNKNSPYKKLRDDWPEFVRYKTSKEGEKQVRRNQQNARQKVYHHKMGSGGYRSVIPKWQRMEANLLAKGIHPFSLKWP